jgi:hypothetical protein
MPETFLIGVIASGLVIIIAEVIGLLQLRSAFLSLSGVDPRNFDGPARFTRVLLIALPLIVMGLVFEILTFQIPLLVFVSAIVALIAGLAAFISYIIGPMIGLWRVGDRFGQNSIKIAVILLFIPLLTFAAPILILVGLRGASQKVDTSLSG